MIKRRLRCNINDKDTVEQPKTIRISEKILKDINSYLLQDSQSKKQSKNVRIKINKEGIQEANRHLSQDQLKEFNPKDKTLIVTGFNAQGAPRSNKRNKQYATLYFQKLVEESDATIILETNCKEKDRIDIHDIKQIQSNNSCKNSGAGTSIIHHRNTKISPYVASLNNEKIISQVLMLENQQKILIMGLNLQLQARPTEEQGLLEVIITQVQKDKRIDHILIYGDFNLDLSAQGIQKKEGRTKGQIKRLMEFLQARKLHIYKTNEHTREAFKQNILIKTQVDYFISTFPPDSIKKIEKITQDENNRGSDHYPIRIEINLTEAKSRYIRKTVNKKQLDLITQKLQKFVRTKQRSSSEIREKINSVKSKVDLKEQNSKQLRRNINEKINQIIKTTSQQYDKTSNPQMTTRIQKLKMRRQIIQNKDLQIQEKVREILRVYYDEYTKNNQSIIKTDPKKYYRNIKAVCRIDNKSRILNTEIGPIENSQKELLFEAEEIQQEIKKFFIEHYKCDTHKKYYSDMGHLSQAQTDKLIETSQTLTSSKGKAISNDLIKDECFSIPNFQAVKQLLKTKMYQKQQTGSYTTDSLTRDQILDKQSTWQINRDNNLRTLLRDILSNPGEYSNVFNARQIYLLKSESRQIINCRPITIQSSIIKILENVALQYVTKLKNEKKVKDFHISQCGFQKNRSTSINICRTLTIIQNTVAKRQNQVAIFVDVKSAFDSVNHDQLFSSLKKQGFDDIFIKTIAFLYEYSRINGTAIGRGVIQGGKLSPILFNYLNEGIKTRIEELWKEKGHKTQDLHFELFADDLLVILKNYKQTKILLEVLQQAYSDTNLKINEAKTKIMLIGKQQGHIKESLKLRQAKNIDIVNEFRYLGLIMNNMGKIHKDVQKKIEKAKNMTNMLKRWRWNKLGMIPCLILWQIFIKSQIQYASGIIVCTEQSDKCFQSLKNMYNSTLRDMLGVSRNTSIETLCQIFGIESMEEMILNSYDTLLNQINANRNLRMQYTAYTRNIKNDIAQRRNKLLSSAIPKSNSPKKNFWWKLNNKFDSIIKLNVYLQNPNGQYCWKCEKYYRSDTWLECEHKIQPWKNLKKLLRMNSKVDIIEVLNCTSSSWEKLPESIKSNVCSFADQLVYQDITKIR